MEWPKQYTAHATRTPLSVQTEWIGAQVEIACSSPPGSTFLPTSAPIIVADFVADQSTVKSHTRCTSAG